MQLIFNFFFTKIPVFHGKMQILVNMAFLYIIFSLFSQVYTEGAGEGIAAVKIIGPGGTIIPTTNR